jgi:hypothetical protein
MDAILSGYLASRGVLGSEQRGGARHAISWDVPLFAFLTGTFDRGRRKGCMLVGNCVVQRRCVKRLDGRLCDDGFGGGNGVGFLEGCTTAVGEWSLIRYELLLTYLTSVWADETNLIHRFMQ